MGGVNSTYDENMVYAVMAYQEKIGLEATGILDINTQIYLADDVRESEVLIDNQLAKAFECLGEAYNGYLLKE